MNNLALIAALGYNNEIGVKNSLPWHIVEDLNFYRRMTLNKNIIMGRNTFESMPLEALKNRNPIVLSSQELDNECDAIYFNNIKSILNYVSLFPENDFLVVGGAKVYEAFLPYVETMYLTEIYNEYPDADTFFPKIDYNCWNNYKIADHMEDSIPYERIKYTRKKVR